MTAALARGGIAFVLAQRSEIVSICGTIRREYIEWNAAAGELKLSDDDIATFSKASPPSVAALMRFPEKQLKSLGI